MKTGKLKIGGKGVAAVTVPIQEPDNLDDLSTLAKGDVTVITRWAQRGHRIESQEASGARAKLKELRAETPAKDEAAIVAEIAGLVANFDPTVKAARGGTRVRKPIEVKTGANGQIDMASFRAQLEAAGVKINFVDASANQAAAPSA